MNSLLVAQTSVTVVSPTLLSAVVRHERGRREECGARRTGKPATRRTGIPALRFLTISRRCQSRSCRLVGLMFFGWRTLSFAGATNATEDGLPKLRPPQGEMPPTFWEQYGLIVVAGGVLSVLLLAVVIWWLTRPKPAAAPPPETLARQALEPLRGQPENGVLLSRVSRVLRRYLSAAFGLPPEQLTTTEFCDALASHAGAGPELAAAVTEFLRRCDERKFAPLPPAPALGAVETALKLTEMAQRQLGPQPESTKRPMSAEQRATSQR